MFTPSCNLPDHLRTAISSYLLPTDVGWLTMNFKFPHHSSTSDFRAAFLKTIRQIIRESVRNMSLPALDSLRKPEPPLRSESTKLSSAHAQGHGSPIGEAATRLI